MRRIEYRRRCTQWTPENTDENIKKVHKIILNERSEVDRDSGDSKDIKGTC
jgi:hypothetical protein